jgi:hypothetical protein
MIERGPATENDVVIAFLRAEIDSSRYEHFVKRGLSQLGVDRSLIDEPNLADAAQNLGRKRLLAFYRGYPNRFLFRGFPLDATWRRVGLELRDLETMRYINDAGSDRHWINLTDGTRLVGDGARNFQQRPRDGATHHIGAIASAIRRGQRFPDLIVAQACDGPLILLEGHSRATAYVMEQFAGEVETLVASSPSMPEWTFY